VTPAMLWALAAALGLGVGLWLLSLWLKDVSIVDIFWGPFFVVIAGVGYAVGAGSGPRRLLVLFLVSCWALRLAFHLARRNLGHGEDPRYQAMRARRERYFWLISLPLVFLLQPALASVVALPLLAVMEHAGPAHLGVLDAVATLVFVVGLGIEVAADSQLRAFRRDPSRRDQVLDSGLFRYSRHPNYFGEFVLWWGFGLFGLAAGSLLSLVGPALMTVLLLRVSGVTLLESTIVTRRPGYARYQATTNAFFPGPPRGAS
jgi:steroid 5-alpha reductase family enzyme